MYFKDRIPTIPNKKKLVFLDDNSTRYAIIENADEPMEDGTPLNALTLDQIVPNGAIIMWSGSADNVPDGWALCDGENGTPDLRGRFVIGAGNEFDSGTIGGNYTIDISHTHIYSGTTYPDNTGEAAQNGTWQESRSYSGHGHGYSGTTKSSGDTDINILPPYYALCYIMKISQMAK